MYPVQEGAGSSKLPGIMALGYIAAFSEALALNTISENALIPLVCILRGQSQEHLKAAAAWTLGQVRHTSTKASWSSTGIVLRLLFRIIYSGNMLPRF